jgi:hypothetical protein
MISTGWLPIHIYESERISRIISDHIIQEDTTYLTGYLPAPTLLLGACELSCCDLPILPDNRIFHLHNAIARSNLSKVFAHMAFGDRPQAGCLPAQAPAGLLVLDHVPARRPRPPAHELGEI